jgi:hypothetical protein
MQVYACVCVCMCSMLNLASSDVNLASSVAALPHDRLTVFARSFLPPFFPPLPLLPGVLSLAGAVDFLRQNHQQQTVYSAVGAVISDPNYDEEDMDDDDQ